MRSPYLPEFWGEPKSPVVVDGRELRPAESWPRHPKDHLRHSLADVTDAANAYRRLCYYLVNESEACERGDLTQVGQNGSRLGRACD